MKNVCLFACIAVLLGGQSAHARGGYKVNPHAPNGYNASMAAYHYHGTKSPGQEMNGYAATSIRSKHGAEPLMVPDGGGGGGRFGGGGGGRFGAGGGDGGFGSGFGRHGKFSQGVSEGRAMRASNFAMRNGSGGENYWSNHFRNQAQPVQNNRQFYGGNNYAYSNSFANPYNAPDQSYRHYTQYQPAPTALQHHVNSRVGQLESMGRGILRRRL